MKRLADFTWNETHETYMAGNEYGGEDKCAVMQHILGWCACGRPEDAQRFVLDGLKLLTERRPDGVQHGPWFAAYRARAEAYFGGRNGLYFFAYWAYKEGLTEHGGGVTSCWLAGPGQDLIADLEEALAAVEEEP